MREILFRGKRKSHDYWIIGDLVRKKDYCFIYFAGVPREVEPETVGQYTGLTDKNGKKIFEGDIVKAYDPLDEISFIGVVKYFDGSFYICDTDFCSYYRWMDYEVEVIGNIFDNSLEELQNGN